MIATSVAENRPKSRESEDAGRALKNITVILSMLHEAPGRTNSATRLFQRRPVLAGTLDRMKSIRHGAEMRTVILCWDDQLAQVEPIADAAGAETASRKRCAEAGMDAITAARKWADGWRGGLLGACEFDRGFHARWMWEIAGEGDCDAVLLVDPSSALLEGELIESVLATAERATKQDFIFSAAAPGLCGVIIRPALLEQLAKLPPQSSHVGRYLHYLPDAPGSDPIGSEACANVAAPLVRTTHRFTLDSERQVRKLERIAGRNGRRGGELKAGEVLEEMNGLNGRDDLPREIILEINTARATSPIYWPGRRLGITRGELKPERAAMLFNEIAAFDDLRLTIGGVGDPMQSEHVLEIIEMAHAEGINAIRVETDLVGVNAQRLEGLAAGMVDVISVHLPATTPGTYEAVMGVNALAEAVENIRTLITYRQSRRAGVPLIVPVFTKCRQNLAEMEAWYDQWLRALGCASIIGPSDFLGRIEDVAVADMAPARRCGCRRLERRMTILSDGTIVACEQDVTGAQAMGRAGEMKSGGMGEQSEVHAAWGGRLRQLRDEHAARRADGHPLCSACREWHRP